MGAVGEDENGAGDVGDEEDEEGDKEEELCVDKEELCRTVGGGGRGGPSLFEGKAEEG